LKLDYHDYYDTQFENLVVELCGDLLGSGMQGFAPGPDGGKDGRFVGTAVDYPSSAAPWSGTIIVQAKHTSALNAKVSDSDFSGEAKTSVLSVEIPRIKAMVDSKKIDHYMLFTNRKLGGVAQDTLLDRLESETGLKKERIAILGKEFLDSKLKRYVDAVRRAGIHATNAPLALSPDALANVILVLKTFVKGEITVPLDLKREPFDVKNVRHRLSQEYVAEILSRLTDFNEIDEFLQHPLNDELKETYLEAVDEFNDWLLANRDQYPLFDDLLRWLVNMLYERDADLSKNRRLTRTFVYYMYWSCDVGFKKCA